MCLSLNKNLAFSQKCSKEARTRTSFNFPLGLQIMRISPVIMLSPNKNLANYTKRFKEAQIHTLFHIPVCWKSCAFRPFPNKNLAHYARIIKKTYIRWSFHFPVCWKSCVFRSIVVCLSVSTNTWPGTQKWSKEARIGTLFHDCLVGLKSCLFRSLFDFFSRTKTYPIAQKCSIEVQICTSLHNSVVGDHVHFAPNSTFSIPRQKTWTMIYFSVTGKSCLFLTNLCFSRQKRVRGLLQTNVEKKPKFAHCTAFGYLEMSFLPAIGFSQLELLGLSVTPNSSGEAQTHPLFHFCYLERVSLLPVIWPYPMQRKLNSLHKSQVRTLLRFELFEKCLLCP